MKGCLCLIGLGLMLAGMLPLAQGDPVPASPPVPAVQTASPVAMFRRLLDMTARERENYLTNRPPQIREAIRAKIREYLAMDPNDRELRLRATELRWRLIPLLRLPPAQRESLLATVPADLAPLVQSRLADWDQLSPALQQEFLANDHTLHYFAHVETTDQPAPPSPPGSAQAAEEQQFAAQFNQFFELNPDERDRTLKTLSATETAQMEGTLAAFGRLTPQQRLECVHGFLQFRSLSRAERAEFLKNAEHWAQMSPQERQTWRDLVARVPQWPPLPPSLIEQPPLPPQPSAPKAHPVMATNHN